MLVENPDILSTLARHKTARPHWSSGLPPKPTDLIANATAKRAAKGCDWIVANDVSTDRAGTGVMGGDSNQRASRHRERHGMLASAGETRSGARGLLQKIAQHFGRAA